MALDPVTAILNVGNSLIDRLLPDKAQNDAAKAALVQMQVKGELDNIQGQIETNKVEAASNSKFVAGWRPWIGWVCGAAMGYAFIGQPVIVTLIAVVQCIIRHQPFDKSMLPIIDMSQMWPVLIALLGMGTLRTVDKIQGNSNGH
jgi:hypothetical protein